MRMDKMKKKKKKKKCKYVHIELVKMGKLYIL